MKKQKIIIFTGHDMAGKTTIAKKISEILKIPYFKSNKQHDKNHNHLLGLQYSIEEFVQLFEQTNYSFILDRFVESEYTYSLVMDRKTDEEKIWDIDFRLSKLNVKYIYCFKDEKNYQEDDLELISKDKYNELKLAFNDFFLKSKCNVFKIDTSDENLENQVKKIIKFLKK